jgi:histidinol dehydrogenase
MRILDSNDGDAVRQLLDRAPRRQGAIQRATRRIVGDVRREGESALRRYAEQLDGLPAGAPLVLGPAAIRRGSEKVTRRLRTAIQRALRNIERVAARELPGSRRVAVSAGTRLVLRCAPLGRVGCYVPGGRAPLVSSLLMTAGPARVAGVREVLVACPRPTPPVLLAARLAGVDRVIRAGGAHAIAALAYGAGGIPAVDKIVGPGNVYVSAAKAMVAADCAIDFHAGPTELVVLSLNGPAEWIAADLVAQGEHDPDARAILVTTSRPLAHAVAREVSRLAARLDTVRRAIARNGGAIVARTVDEAIEIVERIAPEHLACDDERVAGRVRNAGTIFVGPYSAPALGDYATGSNHVLPTAGAARARGGLSAADFVKTTAIQFVTRAGLRRLAPVATELARAESLWCHARSIEVRL